MVRFEAELKIRYSIVGVYECLKTVIDDFFDDF